MTMRMREESLASLISENKDIFYDELKNVINPSFTGLDEPEKYKGIISNFLNQSNRMPFARQARLVSAATEYITKRDNKSLLISSEMGTGKTEMALKISMSRKFTVNFILCPPHLVDKWGDEIEESYDDPNSYKIIKPERWEDLVPYTKRNLKKDGVKYFFIVSKESAKLGYPKRRVFVERSTYITKEVELDGQKMEIKKLVKVACCPDCYNQLLEANDDGHFTKPIPYKCSCGSILREVDKTASKNMQTKVSIAEYVKRNWKKGKIDLLIADEIHEYKGGDTGQGNALAQICSISKKIVGLTGTLVNGYASSLFYILYRLNPELMKKRLGFDYNQVKLFVEKYGAFETSYEAKDVTIEGVVTKKGKKIGIPKEKPKISPFLLSVLLDMTIFLRLDEIKMEEGFGLPDYTEHINLVDMNKELEKNYVEYISEISSKVRKDRRFLGNLANDALAVPDMPFQIHSAQNEIFYEPEFNRNDFGYTNKEKELCDLVKKENEKGRNCLIFVYFSNKGVGTDIVDMLNNELPQFTTKFLKPSIPAKKRKAWIQNNPCNNLACNAELVKTGLDLLEYPTVIFYEPTYNVFTLKQASRRSWRIGQKENVNVHFFAYRDTAQHKALELIGAKVAAANSLEGRLSGDDDLSSLGDEEDNIQLALAKSILNNEQSSNDIHTTSISNFGNDRDWDNFELYYLDKLNEIKENEISKVNEKVIKIETDETNLFNTPVKKSLTKKPKNKPIPKPKQQELPRNEQMIMNFVKTLQTHHENGDLLGGVETTYIDCLEDSMNTEKEITKEYKTFTMCDNYINQKVNGCQIVYKRDSYNYVESIDINVCKYEYKNPYTVIKTISIKYSDLEDDLLYSSEKDIYKKVLTFIPSLEIFFKCEPPKESSIKETKNNKDSDNQTFFIYSGKGKKQKRVEVDSSSLCDIENNVRGGIQLSLF